MWWRSNRQPLAAPALSSSRPPFAAPAPSAVVRLSSFTPPPRRAAPTPRRNTATPTSQVATSIADDDADHHAAHVHRTGAERLGVRDEDVLETGVLPGRARWIRLPALVTCDARHRAIAHVMCLCVMPRWFVAAMYMGIALASFF